MEGTYYDNFTFDQYENNQTKLTVIVPELNKIPDQLTLVPYRGQIEERFEQPIRLDLKATQK